MAEQQNQRTVAIERATRTMFTRIMTELALTLRDEELTVAQIAALYTLDQRGSERVTALATQLGLSPSAASRMFDVLVERQLLSREEDPNDRRARVLTLAPKGRALVERTSERRMAAIFGMAEQFPAVITKTITELVARIGGLLDKKTSASKAKKKEDP